MSESIRISGIIRESIVDGPGFRFVVFAQGCPHNCPECHNPETHSFDGGKLVSADTILSEMKKNSLLKGVTFSGGDPFCQAKAFSELAKMSHESNLDTVCYTGYTFEQILSGANFENGWIDLLRNIDYLIDGPFLVKEKSLLLNFRGSKNQRILDCKKSLKSGCAVITEF